MKACNETLEMTYNTDTAAFGIAARINPNLDYATKTLFVRNQKGRITEKSQGGNITFIFEDKSKLHINK